VGSEEPGSATAAIDTSFLPLGGRPSRTDLTYLSHARRDDPAEP